MAQNMIEHHASITVDAPVHQVYSLFSHFNDFPKFMSFVKEVTYYDEQRSHWVADVAGQHEWDAVNEEWIPDRQIGWRSVNGLNNYGRVVFQPASAQQTHIDVSVDYQPPAGFLGNIGEHMGVGKHFDDVLQKDLNHFAEMVHRSPAGALDPNSSDYLFHDESAAARGKTTERQNATMTGEAAGAATGAGAGYMGETQGSVPQSESATPVRDEALGKRSDIGATAQSSMPRSEGTLADRPTMDRDIISEPTNVVPPEGQQAMATGEPANQTRQNAPNLPPEQIPRWEGPEGEQPQR